MSKRSWMMFSIVMIVPMLTGCTQAMMDSFFAVSHQEAKNMHQITGKKIDDHDKNMTEQHKAMNPKAAEAIDKLRLEYEMKSAALQKELDDMYSKVGENINKLADIAVQLGVRFAGLPPDSLKNILTSEVTNGTEKAKSVSEKDILAVLIAAVMGTAGSGLLGKMKKV